MLFEFVMGIFFFFFSIIRGQTALHKAAQQKRRSICCMLVAGGATLTLRDRHGNTPRQLALIAEDRDLAAYLHSEFDHSINVEKKKKHYNIKFYGKIFTKKNIFKVKNNSNW